MTWTDEGTKLVEQTGIAQRRLSRVGMDVEQATLGARRGRFFGVVHGGGDASTMQRAGENQAAQSGSDNGYR